MKDKVSKKFFIVKQGVEIYVVLHLLEVILLLMKYITVIM